MGAVRLGVMQGRLSPAMGQKIQAYPEGTWRDEFTTAKSLGLSFIEWVVDENLDNNALLYEGHEVKRACIEFGVSVPIVCFDALIDLFPESGKFWASDVLNEALIKILEVAAIVGVVLIELPFVDKASAQYHLQEKEALGWLRDVAKLAAANTVKVGLETDLSARLQIELLAKIDSSNVTLNYDTGNSAFLGLSPEEELPLLRPLISNVHLKDRVRSGRSVPLGTGLADIPLALSLIRPFGHDLFFTLQAARGSDFIMAVRTAADYFTSCLSWESAEHE